MWKDFRNFALVFVAVFSVLSFSVFMKNRTDGILLSYDSVVALKEKKIQENIETLKAKREEDQRELEWANAEKEKEELLKKQQVTKQPVVVDTYVPPVPVVVKPVPIPVPQPVQVPQPSRQTRAS